MKKPRLTVVPTKPSPLAPPATLGQAGAALWTKIQGAYRCDDPPGAAMLEEICGAADRIAECREAIAADGMTIRTKNGVREHPLLRTEQNARAFLVRSLHRLGFDVEPPRDGVGRPPGFNRGRS
jgi:hypothetical protein